MQYCIAGYFLWMGFNCLKATEPLQGGSLLFTTKFPEIPGTHLIDLGRRKAESNLELPSGFDNWTPGMGIQRFNHLAIALSSAYLSNNKNYNSVCKPCVSKDYAFL